MVGVRPATLVGHPRTNHQSVMEHGVSDQPTSSDTSNQPPKCYGISACPPRRIPVLALKAKAGLREQVRGVGVAAPIRWADHTSRRSPSPAADADRLRL